MYFIITFKIEKSVKTLSQVLVNLEMTNKKKIN